MYLKSQLERSSYIKNALYTLSSSIKKYSWAALANSSRIALQLVGIIVLGRLLTPKDYGIVGIMSVFIAIGDMLIDSGMNGAILYKKHIEKIDYSTLFVYNTAISGLLYIIFFILASSIATYYNIPELCIYIRIYCLSLICYAIGLSANTKMLRDMSFKSIAKIQMCSSFVSLSIGILLAILGMGVWSLIIQTISSSLLFSIFSIFVSKIDFSLNFSFNSFKEQFKFGVWLVLSSFIDTICNNIYTNIIPKISNLTSNGCYSRANSLATVPQNLFGSVITQVMFPVLSQTEDKPQYYVKYYGLFSYLIFIFFTLLFVYSPLIISILLGSKWSQASWYLQLLSLAGIFNVIQNLQRTLFKSYAKTKDIFQLQIIKMIVKVITILVPLLYASLEMLIWGLLICSVINTIVSFKKISELTKITIMNQLIDLFKYSSCTMAVIVFFSYTKCLLHLTEISSLILLPFTIIIFILVAYILRIDSQNVILEYLKSNIKFKHKI